MHCPYEPQQAKLVVREMTDLLVLDLVDKGLVTDQMVLTVGYDIENLTNPAQMCIRDRSCKGAKLMDGKVFKGSVGHQEFAAWVEELGL